MSDKEYINLQHELGYADMTIRLQEEQLKTAAQLMEAVIEWTFAVNRRHKKALNNMRRFIANFKE